MTTLNQMRCVLASVAIWSSFTVAHASAAEKSTALRQAEIHGLVVLMAPDGLYHGKVINIIATPGAQHGVSFVETPGREMEISLKEAVRVVKLRHAEAGEAGVEISFGEKYSAKDGGSAGTAFALVLLASYGDLKINPDAAITGDITVDGKVGAVGEVAAKVHGAALDHMALVAIPASDTQQIEDAILLDGPAALWEIPTFSISSLDDAIALMRADPATNLTQALKLFADLKSADGNKPVDSLKTAAAAAKLTQILQLAPNCVSARYLQQLAAGTAPQHLSIVASVRQALAALGPTRKGLIASVGRGGQPVSSADQAKVKEDLQRVERLADPAAEPLFQPLRDFVDTYVKFSNVPSGAAGVRDRLSLRHDVRDRQAAIHTALERIISDRATLDRLLH